MAKSEKTKELEAAIWKATIKQGVFGCFEVTIGWYGHERVDYMTYDTNGTFRCYELKVSVSDFHSKHHNTFVGHLNYYVLTPELYDKVKDEIPPYVGVFTLNKCGGAYCAKRATRQKPTTDIQVLKDSFIRSLFREVEKNYQAANAQYVTGLKSRIAYLEKEVHRANQRTFDLEREVARLYGYRWRHPKNPENTDDEGL